MNFQDILLLRHELLLALAVFILICVEIFSNNDQKKFMVPLSVTLMALITATGFLFPAEGSSFGGMFQTNALRSFMKSVLDIATLLVFLQSYSWITHTTNRGKVSEFFIITISSLIGMDFMISSGDFLMLYLGLELATIPVATLAAFDRYKTSSAEAGVKLILSSALSSGLLLFGLSIIYGTTGSIYFGEVQAAFRMEAFPLLGMVFFITGMGFKISLVPFHLWAADVYEGSPIAVTSYLSVVSKGAAVFIFTYVLYTVFAPISQIWTQLLIVLAILTMTIGNLFALRQQNMKRFLAFSSIAQAGFILLGIVGQGAQGFGSVVFYLLVYVFTNIAAFTVVAAVSNATGKENMADYNGMYHTNPKLCLAMMLALFSLAGIPPVAGFFGKLFLFSAAASKGYYIVLLIAVLNTVVSLYYYLRPIRAMFIEKNETPVPAFKSDIYLRLALALSILGVIATGFISSIYEYLLSIGNVF